MVIVNEILITMQYMTIWCNIHPKITFYRIKGHFQIVDKVDISCYRCIKSKNWCRIRIQGVEKHTKITFSEKKFLKNFDKKIWLQHPFKLVPNWSLAPYWWYHWRNVVSKKNSDEKFLLGWIIILQNHKIFLEK